MYSNRFLLPTWTLPDAATFPSMDKLHALTRVVLIYIYIYMNSGTRTLVCFSDLYIDMIVLSLTTMKWKCNREEFIMWSRFFFFPPRFLQKYEHYDVARLNKTNRLSEPGWIRDIIEIVHIHRLPDPWRDKPKPLGFGYREWSLLDTWLWSCCSVLYCVLKPR